MSIQDKNFLGLDGFVWWFGVVENRQDPLNLGRVQVRIYGWHSESLNDIPTENLPWAHIIHSVNDRAFATPREADTVFGFFSDGRNGQFPVVLGLVPGYFTDPPNTGVGFHDLRSQDTLKLSPKRLVKREYKTDGSGIKLTEANTSSNSVLESMRHPNKDELGKDSITGIASYENLANTVIQARKDNLDEDVVTAKSVQWSEPYPAYNPLYPYDQANETESGHVFEMDDTPGFERIHIAHRTGTFVEWFPTGTKVEKITKSNYQIVMADDHLHVMGRCMITVDGDALIRVKGDVALESGGNVSANVAGDMDFSVGGAFNVKANSSNFDIGNDITVVSKTQHYTASQSVDVSAKTINESSSGDLNINAGGGGFFSSGGDLNLKAGGAGNFQSGGAIGVTGSTATIAGGTVSLSGTIANPVLDPQGGIGTINTAGSPTSAAQASTAASGSPAGLPNAIATIKKNTGEALPETVPVPLSDNIPFDPYTAQSYKQQQYLVPDNTGNLVTPDSPAANTSNANTSNANTSTGSCGFDPQSHTFISDSSTWAMSDNGLAFLKGKEGFAKVISTDVVQAYADPHGQSSTYAIGYGTQGPSVGETIVAGTQITRQTAEEYLTRAINNKFLPVLKQSISVPLTQNMIDALLSFMYNIGTGGFQKSTCRVKINQQQWCGAADAILMWNKVSGNVDAGLVQRRNDERGLFLS